MKTKLLILPLLLGLSILASGCTDINGNNKSGADLSGKTVGMANPASVYCEENGGTLELVYDNGESYGMCHFQNGSVCEEREFYRKECNPQIENHKEVANILDTDEESQNKTDDTKENTVCTMEAKECPDGSFVSRTGSSCKFTACPNSDINQETGLTEDDIDLMENIIEKLKQ